jgi:AraC-like DNA-binding protein
LASSTALNGLAARKERCPVTRLRLYGQRGAEPHHQKGLGMKRELLTVKELAAEVRMSPKSIQRA